MSYDIIILNSFLGHSELRVAVMGLERTTSRIRPSETELAHMEELLEQALDAGCIGPSVTTTRLDKNGRRARLAQPAALHLRHLEGVLTPVRCAAPMRCCRARPRQ